jgi:hypothetical protein
MKRTLLSIALLGLCSSAFAQNKNIVVLGGSRATQSKNSKHKHKESSMAIKIPAFNFISGNMSICVEKEYKNIGLLVGAGPTFRRFYNDTYLANILDEDQVTYSWADNPNISSVTMNPFAYDANLKFKYSMGYYFVVNPRYYYNEEGMEGGFFGVQIATSQYNYKTQDFNLKEFNKPGHDRFTDVLVQWGGQYNGEKMLFEFTTGMGLRFKDEQRYAYTYDNNSQLQEGTAEIKKASLRFDIGFRVGFKW